MKEWLSIKEVISIYGISDSSQYTMRKERKIPYSKIGGTIRYSKKKLDKWFEDNAIDIKDTK